MRWKTLLVGVACAAWAGGVLAGLVLLDVHAGTAAASVAPPARWPAGARVALDPALPTLLVFAHPRCPCTDATLEELNRVLAHCDGRVAVTVLFRSDPALGADWAHGRLWDEATALPGVAVLQDPLGALARRFGVRTSGHALLYAPDGSLLFEGGLTLARGHAGDSPGAAAVQDLVLHGHGPAHAPVFGCGLFDPEETSP